MCDPIKSIATRLRGLREVLELSEQEVADSCRLSVDEALASGFRDRRADPFIVTVEPSAADAPMHLNCHTGQEMNYVLEGRLLISVSGKELVLGVGDSLYFDSGLPHGMKALDGKPVRFLAIIM